MPVTYEVLEENLCCCLCGHISETELDNEKHFEEKHLEGEMEGDHH